MKDYETVYPASEYHWFYGFKEPKPLGEGWKTVTLDEIAKRKP